MGLFGLSGNAWKKIGGFALQAAPYIAAPFTAGLSIPLATGIKAGIGAATGAATGGWKGAALGGGLGLIPGGSLAKNALVPGLKAGLVAGGTSALKNVGTQAAVGGGLAAVSKAFGGGKDSSAQPSQAAPTLGNKDGGGMDWGQYGPLIAQGAGAVVGGIASKKAQKSAMQRSPEEQQALQGAQGAAGALGKAGSSLLEQSKPYIQGPANYYQTLLRGNRAAMTEAVAPGIAQVTGAYRGAERDLDRQGVRGAQRDVAASELGREKASKIAGLTTGVQGAAADKLAAIGTQTLSQSGPMTANAGNIYGNLLTGGAANRAYAGQQGAEAGKAWGGLVRDIGNAIPTGGKKKPAPTPVPWAIGQAPPMPQYG